MNVWRHEQWRLVMNVSGDEDDNDNDDADDFDGAWLSSWTCAGESGTWPCWRSPKCGVKVGRLDHISK